MLDDIRTEKIISATNLFLEVLSLLLDIVPSYNSVQQNGKQWCNLDKMAKTLISDPIWGLFRGFYL